MRQLRGPAALDAQERCGVITSGFAEPTLLDRPWNPSLAPEIAAAINSSPSSCAGAAGPCA